jgi:two-component system phosphate regulon sensor histidine kinase PhoR
MEAGRRVYDLLPESIGMVVEQAVADFQAATIGQARVVETRIVEGLPTMLVDRGALADALVNLLTNAHKYSALDAPIAIEVRGEGPEVWIAVRDRGIGIDVPEQKHIFEKFYRVDDRLSRKVEGSGLGLSIVQHVANAHRGSIEVESARGQGSTFTLKLPIPPAGSLPQRSSHPPKPSKSPGTPKVAASLPGGGRD